MHAGQPSISCEKVGLSCARGVISDAHVVGNDGSKPYSATCGWRNSLREGFFDKLRGPADIGGPPFEIKLVLKWSITAFISKYTVDFLKVG